MSTDTLAQQFAAEFIRKHKVWSPVKQAAIRDATETSFHWATANASTYIQSIGEGSEESAALAQAGNDCLNAVKQERYGSIVGSLAWIVVSAILSLLVQEFVRWLFFSEENFQSVVGTEY